MRNVVLLTYFHLLKSSREKSFDEITINDFPTKYQTAKYAVYVEKRNGINNQKPLK